MPRVSKFEILHKREQPTLSIRTTTELKNLPMLIGESYGRMASYLEECGGTLSDVPFVAYHNLDMENLDIEIGFPVASSFPDKGNIKSSCIPEGKVVFCMYRGSYGDVEPVYNEMLEWINENKFNWTGAYYEYYYNGNEFPEDELLTMMAMPVN